MLADFRFSRRNTDAGFVQTSRIMGTLGFVAPEYMLSGRLTVFTDIFAYGVILYELLSGTNVDRQSMIHGVVRDNLFATVQSGDVRGVVGGEFLKDPTYDEETIFKLVCGAASCVRKNDHFRPSMEMIVQVLEDTLPVEAVLHVNGGPIPGESLLPSF
ncbi:putative protein kinase RLK-Pelle-PERK-1 family [Helianthus annuus]|nr:putative protein kinase RLK-Pelle-PERK-1 family [Helianthus annuus]